MSVCYPRGSASNKAGTSAAGYQACTVSQRGQRTVVDTGAWKTYPQSHE